MTLVCHLCGKPFDVIGAQLQEGAPKYCSRVCRKAGRDRSITRTYRKQQRETAARKGVYRNPRPPKLK